MDNLNNGKNRSFSPESKHREFRIIFHYLKVVTQETIDTQTQMEYDLLSNDMNLTASVKTLVDFLVNNSNFQNSDSIINDIVYGLEETGSSLLLKNILTLEFNYSKIYNLYPRIFETLKNISKASDIKSTSVTTNWVSSGQDNLAEALKNISIPKEAKKQRRKKLMIFVWAGIGAIIIPGIGFWIGLAIGLIIYMSQ